MSEAKEVTSPLGQVPVPKALQQLNKVMESLVEKNLASEVEAVQIITTKDRLLKGGYAVRSGGRLVKLAADGTEQFVTPTGRPDLIVRVIEL